MREAVGMQRDRSACCDREQAEGRPGGEQRPWRGAGPAREHVDDAPEQHGLGELRAGEQQIGEGENPAELRLLAEQFEDAGIEAEEVHAELCDGRRSAAILIVYCGPEIAQLMSRPPTGGRKEAS